jgi:hypothetical protein
MYAIVLFNACATENRDLAIFATLWLVIIDKERKEHDD